MQNLLVEVKNFIKTRALGFYFTLAATILAIIQAIIYSIAFNDPLYVQYFSTTALTCSIFAIVLGVILSCTKWTERWAPAAIAALELAAFMMFIRDGYRYFTTQFYGGVTTQAILSTYYGYLYSIVFFIIILGLSVASIYLKQSKILKKKGATNEN